MSRQTLLRAAVPPTSATEEPSDIVLVFLDHNQVTPYVTWHLNLTSEDTYWGHYFKTCEEAIEDYIKRCSLRSAVMYNGERPVLAKID
jgi:hypothetical protein